MRIPFTSSLASALRWRSTRKIFISYRRADTHELAERLYDRLSQHFGAANVFLDRADIERGQRWRDELTGQVRAADVVIALIGPSWLETLRAREMSDDVLRFELASALAQKKQIIPILVGATPMPDAGLLPGEVKGLADFQALTITPDGIDHAVRELLGRLKPGFGLAVSWAFANLFGWLIGLLVLLLTSMSFGGLEGDQRPSANSVLAFAIAGALLGLCVGVPQWLVLRAWFDRARFLIPVYVLLSAIAIGYSATSALADQSGRLGASILMIMVLPIGLGTTLWWIVRKELVHAGWWSAANVGAPFAGLIIAGANHSPAGTVQESVNLATLSNFFLPMLVPSLISGLLLVWLMRRSQIERS